MADPIVENAASGGNESDVEIAYRLFLDVAYAENMDIRAAPNPSGEKATRNWIIRTFGYCHRQIQRIKTEE
jgi:hypothetical protein